jgi:DNA-binding transcriptional ArsR family regulator
MSHKRRSTLAAKLHTHASVFAALGDDTRLALIAKLARGRPYSISRLTKGSKLTRQAISKHLRVLQTAGMVQSTRTGRETLFELNPQPIVELKEYLDFVSEQWDQALSRLKSLVER